MDNYINFKPHLIEPGTKYFLREALKKCHEIRCQYINMLFNIGLLILFLLVLGIILFTKYKGRLSPMEKIKKELIPS